MAFWYFSILQRLIDNDRKLVEQIRKDTYPSIAKAIVYSWKFGMVDWERMKSTKIFKSTKIQYEECSSLLFTANKNLNRNI